MTEESRQRTLSILRALAGRVQDHDWDARMLTGEDVRRLASGRWVEVGAHTVSHPSLSGLTLDVQRREIGSRRSPANEQLDQNDNANRSQKPADKTHDTPILTRASRLVGLPVVSYHGNTLV